MKRNYQKELEQILEKENPGKRLLLHSCCAPCSSYVLIYLRQFFRITVFYYNPNITFEKEYWKRAEEQKRLIRALNEEKTQHFPINIMEGSYEPERFLEAAKGLKQCPEGGERCRKCFELRLFETAKMAEEGAYDYFTTTLTISPLKNAELLNEVGREAAKRFGSVFLPSDFKKKNGYQQSVLLSEKYGLYRQDYCGCAFSKAERMAHLEEQNRMKLESETKEK